MNTPLITSLGELRTLFFNHPLFLVGSLLILGYFLGKLFGRLRLPEVSGFIFAGLLVNSFTTGLVTHELNASLHIVTETAIGLLALSVGAEFSARKMRRIGRNALIITLVGLAVTFSVVVAGCIGLSVLAPSLPIGYPYAVLLGVMACATAPAIIVAEVHHLRAHGRFIDYLFTTVALGDALSVVIFGFAFTLVTNVLDVQTAGVSTLAASLREIALSVIAGGVGGVMLHLLTVRLRNPGELLIVTIGIVFATTGLSIVLHLSALLVNMVLGAVLVNLSSGNHRLFRQIEPLTPPIYALFFVIAGIELNPALFLQRNVALVGLFYIALRALGRYGGAWYGVRLCSLPLPLQRNLGLCMLSQGGIALGFVLLIQTSPQLAGIHSDMFALLVNIVLVSIFINELASPFLLRFAIVRGNEMEES